jgi:excisionase family DNA binding protein
MTKQKQETLSVTDAAKRLGIEVNYVYGLVRSGRLEARKAKREWLISAEAVRERQQRLASNSR